MSSPQVPLLIDFRSNSTVSQRKKRKSTLTRSALRLPPLGPTLTPSTGDILWVRATWSTASTLKAYGIDRQYSRSGRSRMRKIHSQMRGRSKRLTSGSDIIARRRGIRQMMKSTLSMLDGAISMMSGYPWQVQEYKNSKVYQDSTKLLGNQQCNMIMVFQMRAMSCLIPKRPVNG